MPVCKCRHSCFTSGVTYLERNRNVSLLFYLSGKANPLWGRKQTRSPCPAAGHELLGVPEALCEVTHGDGMCFQTLNTFQLVQRGLQQARQNPLTQTSPNEKILGKFVLILKLGVTETIQISWLYLQN